MRTGNGRDSLLAKNLHLVGKRQESFAAWREFYLPSSAIKEWNAELFFERLDLLRHRRLREEKLLGSPAEVKVMSDSAKDADAEVLKHQRTTTSMGNV